MEGLLIINSVTNYAFKQLTQEANKRNIKLYTPWENFKEVEFTLNRKYIDKYVPIQQGLQINRIVEGIYWGDKIKQANILETYCKKPLTHIGREVGFNYLQNLLGIPFIAKDNISSRGKGVYLIYNIDDFLKASTCSIFQEVIWDSLGKDVRVFCIDGKPIRCMLRQNEENFKSNFHQGGKGSIYPIDSEIEKIVNSIYKCTNLNIMGIDLLLDKNGYTFCELNVNPGFEELDRVHNSNTASDILDYCISKLK